MRFRLPFLSIFFHGMCHAQPTLLPEHLTPFTGSWRGELDYLDYSSGERTRIPATLLVEPLDDRRWRMGFGYIEEPHANEKDTLVLAEDGSLLGNATVLGAEQYGADSVCIHLSVMGEDDGHPALIARTWRAGPRGCTLLKEVRLVVAPGVPEGAYFFRHEYRFVRE